MTLPVSIETAAACRARMSEMRNEPVPRAPAELVYSLRVVTGEPIATCAKAIAALPEDRQVEFVEQVERGEKRVGPPGPR